MVYAFFVQSVHRKFCEVLHSHIFNAEGENTTGWDCSREWRKRALDVVAKRVSVEYEAVQRLRAGVIKAAAGTTYDGDCSNEQEEEEQRAILAKFRSDGILPDLETGMFALNPLLEPHYGRGKIVLWCVALHTAFILILEHDENRVLANIHLKFLVKYLQDHVQAMTNPRELVAKPDIVMHIVDCLIPAGQLRFVNYKGIKQIEKDMEKRITSGTK